MLVFLFWVEISHWSTENSGKTKRKYEHLKEEMEYSSKFLLDFLWKYFTFLKEALLAPRCYLNNFFKIDFEVVRSNHIKAQ